MKGLGLRLLVLALAAALTMPAWPAIALERPVVEVKLLLQELAYRREFSDQEILNLEAEASARIAKLLQTRIGFAKFQPLRGEAATGPLLTFKLGARDQGPSTLLKEVGLHIELSGHGGGGSSKRVYWLFRPQERYRDAVGNPAALLREIELRIGDADYTTLIREVLSGIPIARTGQMWTQPLGWIVPHRQADLCMEVNSVLWIENAVPSGAGPIIRSFRARAAGSFQPPGPTSIENYRGFLFSEASPQQEGLNDLAGVNPEMVEVRAVYVLEYISLGPCGTGVSGDPLAPDNQDFRRPGGRP